MFLLGLAAALAAQDPPVTLVLDDLHLLTDPGVLDGLDYVLRNAGPGLRLVVSARMDPLLPLHRYRLAGQLAEIGAGDLAFAVAEAGLLLARHGHTLTAGSLERLTRRTGGWAAKSLRLAAISMGTHPDPGQFAEELITDDSALTGYLVQEVLGTQPPAVRDVLLNTSILEQVSAQAARELTGNERAGTGDPPGPGARERICPADRVRVVPLPPAVRRGAAPDAQARSSGPAGPSAPGSGPVVRADRPAHRRGAARRPRQRLAARRQHRHRRTGDRRDHRAARNPSLADEFAGLPHGQAWTGPEPHLVSAAVALSAGRPTASTSALDAADDIWRSSRRSAAHSLLAAAMIRLAASRRTGAFMAAAAAAAEAEALISMVPGEKLTRHPDIRARVLSGHGAVEPWSGHLGEAARTFESGVAAVTASGGADERAACLGHLALAEALRGRLSRAATAAAQTTVARTAGQPRPPVPHPHPAALVALAWVHLERNELREAHNRLKQADAALTANPDKLIGAVAPGLAAACGALAGPRAAAAAQIIATARSGWSVPAWLDQRLSLAESRAYAAAGDIPAALAAAGRAGRDHSPEAAVAPRPRVGGGRTRPERDACVHTGAHRQGSGAPERVRVEAWLVDAQLGYRHGDRARGRGSLARALRLAEPEQLRLPFVIERDWIGPVLRCDPELARAHQRLLAPAPRDDLLPAPTGAPDQAPVLVAEPLTEREQEVLRHLSGLLSSAEVASEMHISVNTVKTHVAHIYRKLRATTRRGEAVRRARHLELI